CRTTGSRGPARPGATGGGNTRRPTSPSGPPPRPLVLNRARRRVNLSRSETSLSCRRPSLRNPAPCGSPPPRPRPPPPSPAPPRAFAVPPLRGRPGAARRGGRARGGCPVPCPFWIIRGNHACFAKVVDIGGRDGPLGRRVGL